MENKLYELRNNYCRDQCEFKNNDIPVLCEELGSCNTCSLNPHCSDGWVEPCSICRVDEYIRFIRDQLK